MYIWIYSELLRAQTQHAAAALIRQNFFKLLQILEQKRAFAFAFACAQSKFRFRRDCTMVLYVLCNALQWYWFLKWGAADLVRIICYFQMQFEMFSLARFITQYYTYIQCRQSKASHTHTHRIYVQQPQSIISNYKRCESQSAKAFKRTKQCAIK